MRTETLARRLIAALLDRGLTMATAESCTGGGIGHALTAVPGSSGAYLGGVISYTNGVKEKLLGVPHDVLETLGAVSPETARAMAQGVRTVIGADLAVSVTGLAGPDGDGSGKPVGLVYIGCATAAETQVREFRFSGSRRQIREQAVCAALEIAGETCAWKGI